MLRGRRLDTQLDDEVQFHLEMLTQDYVRRGLSLADARAAALRSFGGVTQMKEEYREQRGLPFVEVLAQDVRYGVRALLRTKAFTAAALVTLALGIGANSAIFSVVHAVLLRPLDYAEPERIVQLHRRSGGLWAGQTGRRYLFFRDHLKSLDALAAWRGTSFNLVAGSAAAEYVPALAVSKEYFTVFAGTPLYGRVFTAADDQDGGPDVVILRHGLWQRLFAGDPSVVGRTLSLGDRTFEIVGVMPKEFDTVRTAELYVPLQPGVRGPGGGLNYTVAGRLRRDVTLAQANAEADAVFAAYVATLPNPRFEGTQEPVFVPYHEALSRSSRPALLLMLGAVGMLLLIACANTVNLLLARASGRAREISVRAALGASRRRIVRQLLTESVLLFVTGGLLGVAIAYWTVPALLAMMPVNFLPPVDVRVDGTVLGATLLLAVVTGLVFGLAPALSLSRPNLGAAFRDDGSRTTFGRRSGWLRRGLVVAEVGLCMLLLVGSGLLLRTFLSLRAVEPGFDASDLVVARMSLHGDRYAKAADVNRLYDLGLERLRRIPGVESVAVVNSIPLEFGLNLNVDFLETPEVETMLTDWRYATADYFKTMGIAMKEGRAFDAGDHAGAPRVAVVSAEFAKRFYKKGSPIGRRIKVFAADGALEIVGVAGDLRESGLTGPLPAVMYVPVAQTHDAAVRTSHQYFQVSWIVRSSGRSPEQAHRIAEELRALDPRQPVTSVRSMDEIKARAMSAETFQMSLLSSFAAIGLVLASAGIYGLIAYSVSQRTREFGIRLALGATRTRILVSVVRQGALLAAGGIVAGAAAAIVLRRVMQQSILDLAALDARTIAAVAVLLVLVAVLASVVPALRAVRLNPVSALREG
jgi:predicted permease